MLWIYNVERTLSETYVATLPVSLFLSNSLVASNIYIYVTTQWVTITNFGFNGIRKKISNISYNYNHVFYVHTILLLMHFTRYLYVTLNLYNTISMDAYGYCLKKTQSQSRSIIISISSFFNSKENFHSTIKDISANNWKFRLIFSF